MIVSAYETVRRHTIPPDGFLWETFHHVLDIFVLKLYNKEKIDYQQITRKDETQSYRACKMAASCHVCVYGGIVCEMGSVFFI